MGDEVASCYLLLLAGIIVMGIGLGAVLNLKWYRRWSEFNRRNMGNQRAFRWERLMSVAVGTFAIALGALLLWIAAQL